VSRDARGFSIVELVIAAAIMSACGGAILSLVIAGQRIARVQPEAADQQQRARMAIETLTSELSRAGAGLDRGARAGPLAAYFTPAETSTDAGLTIWYIAAHGGQAAMGAALAPSATDVLIDSAGACPPAQQACGFTRGNTAIMFDGGGCRDAGRIDDVAASALVLRAAMRTCAYSTGAAIAEGVVRTYRVDPLSRQLLRRDEGTGTTAPVVDNVGSMTIEWLDGARRARITLRVVATLLHFPDLVVAIDAAPPNLQERW
jgi:type II secretory pathway pseudopilin PulG